jgi:hypothetical protein
MRRLVFLLYAFHFLVAADGNAVIPLVPTYTASYGLSVFEAGLIVGCPRLRDARSLPAGRPAERPVGARAVTIAASALLTISALGQSLAGSYAVLLASWTLFGVTSAITSGQIARLGDRLPPARRLGSRHARPRRGAADPGGRQLRVTGDRLPRHPRAAVGGGLDDLESTVRPRSCARRRGHGLRARADESVLGGREPGRPEGRSPVSSATAPSSHCSSQAS